MLRHAVCLLRSKYFGITRDLVVRTAVAYLKALELFIWASWENHHYDEFRSRWKRERKTVSDF